MTGNVRPDSCRYGDSLRAGRSEVRIQVGPRFSAPVQTGPGDHPPSSTVYCLTLDDGTDMLSRNVGTELQRGVVSLCRRFGTTYRSHLKGPSDPRLLEPWILDRYVVPKRRYRIAAWSGNSVPTFRDNLTVPSSRAKRSKTSWTLNIGPICCPETSVQNYHCTLRTIAEERSVISIAAEASNPATPRTVALLTAVCYSASLFSGLCGRDVSNMN
jgi:hypothetical protein